MVFFCVNCKQKIVDVKNSKFRLMHLRNRDVKLYSHIICNKKEDKEFVFARLQTVWCDNKKYLYDHKTSKIYYWRKEVFNFYQPSEKFQKEVKINMKFYDRELIVNTTMQIYQKISKSKSNKNKKKFILEIFDFLSKNKEFLKDNKEYSYGIKQKICYFYFIDEWKEVGKIYEKLFDIELPSNIEEINLHLSYSNPEIYFDDPKKHKKSGFYLIPHWYENKLDYDITKKKKNLVKNTLAKLNSNISNHFTNNKYYFVYSHSDKNKYGNNYLFTAMMPMFKSISNNTPKEYFCERNIFLKKDFEEYFLILDLHQFYKYKTINSDENICGICISDISEDAIKLPCNHVFCRSKKWECFGIQYCYLLDKNNFKCPYCRKKINF